MWTLALTALGAPRFSGLPEDVALAELAWEGARVCTGREGLAEPEVEILRRALPGDYLGVARTDPDTGRLQRIDLNAPEARHREVLVHEVAHAWVSEGPIALVEGTAELIADCIVSTLPGLAPLQFDDGRDIAALPDLLSWEGPSEDRPFDLHAVRTDAYVGAARLLRTAALVVPQKALWSSREVSWDSFQAQLEGSGPQGRALWAALAGGARTQRAALADVDQDGLVALAESWAGLDDHRYDTDGDGWWDGGPAGPSNEVLPLDGTPICTQRGTGVLGGNLRGAVASWAQTPLPWGDAALVGLLEDLPAAHTGGLAWLGGAPASGCLSTARVTVWAVDPAMAEAVGPMVDAIERMLDRAEARLSMGPQRVALAIGGRTSTVEGATVMLTSAEVAADPLGAAALTVALRRLWADGERSWPAGMALAQAITRD